MLSTILYSFIIWLLHTKHWLHCTNMWETSELTYGDYNNFVMLLNTKKNIFVYFLWYKITSFKYCFLNVNLIISYNQVYYDIQLVKIVLLKFSLL